MEWFLLSLLGAFGQAVGWAIKKYSLGDSGNNAYLGLISYLTAGFCLGTTWLLQEQSIPSLSVAFYQALLIAVCLNVLAAWTAYKALEKASYSALMALIPVTSILIVPLEFILLKNIPNIYQIGGILITVVGGMLLATNKKITGISWKVAILFGITLCCYAITSTYMKVMVVESYAPLYAASLLHIGIGIGFGILVILEKIIRYKSPKNSSGIGKLLPWMFLSGIVIAILENGPIFFALTTGNASEVFSVKRLMPVFALFIGYVCFREYPNYRQIVATFLMMVGAIVVLLFSGA